MSFQSHPEVAGHHFWTLLAIDFIKKRYGQTVRTDRPILIRGSNDDLDSGTQESIMTLPGGVVHETYLTDNLITEIVSDNAADNQPIIISGHTVSGGNFTLAPEQTITLNGTTPVSLTTPLARVHDAENVGTSSLQGTVSVQQAGGAPAAVHLQIKPGENASFKAAYTTASDEFLIGTQINASVDQKGNAAVAIEYQVGNGSNFLRSAFKKSCAAQGPDLDQEFKPFPIIPPNTDIRVVGTSDTNNVPVSAGFFGIILKVY